MTEVTLTIAAEGAYRVYDEFAEESIPRNDDGSFRVTAEFPSGGWLEGYLLSFGTLLEDVAPSLAAKRADPPERDAG